MAFTRKFLIDNGVPEDKVDAIMAERNRTLSDYIPKSDVQAQIDEAMKKAPAPVNVTETEEYKKLMAENLKIKALGSDDFAPVKTPYRDIVWDKLDHAEKHKPYSEQLGELSKNLPDLFNAPTPEPDKPIFGGETKGNMPTGDAGKSFMDSWGYMPKKN